MRKKWKGRGDREKEMMGGNEEKNREVEQKDKMVGQTEVVDSRDR